MSVPGIVQSTLDGEEIATRVSLGGEDELFVTPTRTLVYRAEGLLSDESVEEFSHEADRLTLSEGRRKTTFTLEYPLEGTSEFTIPSSKTDAALHPVLAGVLNGNDITEAGETVVQTYRFSELTLIVTSDRLVKHIGSAVWDEDYEEYHYGDVTNLDFEAGSVATQIVLEVDGRPQRIKAPNDEADDLSERLKRALFEYHDVDSLEELNALVDDDGTEESESSMDFGDGVDPLNADPPEPEEYEGEAAAETTTQSAGSEATTAESTAGGPVESDDGGDTAAESDWEFETESGSDTSSTTVEAGDVFEDADATDEAVVESDPTSGDADAEILERLEALETAVEAQSERIEAQQETIEQLIAELRQGR
ncbi:DUF7115 domain-containing protein [Halopiger goleimassiliensis]|uniref:DUF7115 domain-containing protein n=1 Tax=Halopiger goleimassiliensis TaxID=1293048 RepID=UPI000677844B|nr:hypothetical protein [Halopiger goleimassiliensis]